MSDQSNRIRLTKDLVLQPVHYVAFDMGVLTNVQVRGSVLLSGLVFTTSNELAAALIASGFAEAADPSTNSFCHRLVPNVWGRA